MRPTAGTEFNLMMARTCAIAAQIYIRQGRWDKANQRATEAGDYMKKVQWGLVK